MTEFKARIKVRLSKALHGDSTSKMSTYFCIIENLSWIRIFQLQEIIVGKSINLKPTKQRQFNVIVCCEITKTHSTCKLLVYSLISTLLFIDGCSYIQKTTHFISAHDLVYIQLAIINKFVNSLVAKAELSLLLLSSNYNSTSAVLGIFPFPGTRSLPPKYTWFSLVPSQFLFQAHGICLHIQPMMCLLSWSLGISTKMKRCLIGSGSLGAIQSLKTLVEKKHRIFVLGLLRSYFLAHVVYQPKSLIQSCFVHHLWHRQCHPASALVSVHTLSDTGLYVETLYLVHIYTYIPHLCTSNI